MPHGNYTWSPPHAAAEARHARSSFAKRSCRRTICSATTPVPTARDPDYQALRIATAVLSGRFFTEIRSRRNLSYEVEAPFVERAISNGGVYVTTDGSERDARVDARARSIGCSASSSIRTDSSASFSNSSRTIFLKNETNGDQATFLARAQIYQGDYRAANRFVDDLRRVRPEDVRRVARQYMHDFRFVYLGKSDALSRASDRAVLSASADQLAEFLRDRARVERARNKGRIRARRRRRRGARARAGRSSSRRPSTPTPGSRTPRRYPRAARGRRGVVARLPSDDAK